MTITLEQYKGCLLGLAVGDAFGAPFEGLTDYLIYQGFGSVEKLIQSPPVEKLHYTDDTEMMISVCETLVQSGGIDQDILCKAFAENYTPGRGYGQGARKIIEAIIDQQDHKHLAETIFPGGSLGNGAAMRVAPVGLCFCGDIPKIKEQARLSAVPTHVHPVGIEGARILAIAVSLAVQQKNINYKEFYQTLLSHAQTEPFQWKLSLAAEVFPEGKLGILGNSLEADNSVVTAIACFLYSPDSYEETIAAAVSLGNDTDTIAAMAGAVSGAHLGIQAIPVHLLEMLEDTGKGRSYIENLAEQLHRKFSD